MAQEFIESMNYLGATYEMMNLPTRELSNYRQEILDKLWQVKNANDYDLIFCHSRYDQHQDHQVVQRECFRAFKNKTILGYELPWNNLDISNRCFIEVQEQDLKNKVDSILEYKSQSFRNYINEEYIRSLMVIRGKQIDFNLAESFEVIRLIF